MTKNIFSTITSVVMFTAMSVGVYAASHQMPAGNRAVSPDGAKVYIISPKDGETVKNPFKVVMGLSGMGIAPAGIDVPDTGHHHLLIDVAQIPSDKAVPTDGNHRHFGKGQTETTLKLAPGTHTLQLMLGDKLHVPHNPPVVSQKITITVTE